MEVPRIDPFVKISVEYINKLEESLKKNLTEIKRLSNNDTDFKQYIDNAISYMKTAKKINDTWKKLRYLREAYFELVKAKAYYLFKKGEIGLQTMYNRTHYMEKIFKKYKREILEKDIYIGKDIDTTVVRSYEIEYLLTVGESYIHDAYRTLGMEDLPTEKKIINTAYDIAVIKTIIRDSYELYKEVIQGNNQTNCKSYKQIIINVYRKIHNLVKKTADEN